MNYFVPDPRPLRSSPRRARAWSVLLTTLAFMGTGCATNASVDEETITFDESFVGKGDNPSTRVPLPEDLTRVAKDLAVQSTSDGVQIYLRRSSKLKKPMLQKLRALAVEALRYDMRVLKVDPQAEELEVPIRIVILDHAAYYKEGEGRETSAAMAYQDENGDVFVIPEDGMLAADFNDSVAHELVHILQFRMARAADDNATVIEQNGVEVWRYPFPQYFDEGMAVVIGARFSLDRREPIGSFVTDYVRMTPRTAANVLSRYEFLPGADADLAEDEGGGALFVEYLRAVHPVNGARGFADTFSSLLKVRSETTSEDELRAAFARAFGGLSLADAKAAFLAWMRAQTEPGANFETDGQACETVSRCGDPNGNVCDRSWSGNWRGTCAPRSSPTRWSGTTFESVQ